MDNTLMKNPHYPGVPPVQEVKYQISSLKVFGKCGQLYDYIGNDAIAGMLNLSYRN